MFKFEEGDTVRVSKVCGKFAKCYEQTSTEKYFMVAEGIHTIPPVYRLEDYDGENIDCTFYDVEL